MAINPNLLLQPTGSPAQAFAGGVQQGLESTRRNAIEAQTLRNQQRQYDLQDRQLQHNALELKARQDAAALKAKQEQQQLDATTLRSQDFMLPLAKLAHGGKLDDAASWIGASNLSIPTKEKLILGLENGMTQKLAGSVLTPQEVKADTDYMDQVTGQIKFSGRSKGPQTVVNNVMDKGVEKGFMPNDPTDLSKGVRPVPGSKAELEQQERTQKLAEIAAEKKRKHDEVLNQLKAFDDTLKDPDFSSAVGFFDGMDTVQSAKNAAGTKGGVLGKRLKRHLQNLLLDKSSVLSGTLTDSDMQTLRETAPALTDNERVWKDWYEREFMPLVTKRFAAEGLDITTKGFSGSGQSNPHSKTKSGVDLNQFLR